MIVPAIQLLADVRASYDVDLTVHEALSGIFGSISLASWIFLLLPQLLENYRNQSAEAVSLPFIFLWFVGDICNLVGGLWADLVPVVIAIAGYFCISDGVLIGQTLYYGIRNRRREGKSLLDAARSTVNSNETFVGAESGATIATREQSNQDGDEESTPLLRRSSRTASITIPGSTSTTPLLSRRRGSDVSSYRARRRSSAAYSSDNHNDAQLTKILEESDSESGARLWLKNVISIFAICAIGTAGWAFAYESGAWVPTAPPEPNIGVPEPEPMDSTAKGAQVLGYASAVLYVCARIPQIIKNWREKSCEGLSLLFFILSLIGNLTYGAGIILHSTQRAYIVKNVPWLIGSLGTMAEDVIIFIQFHIYRDNCTAVLEAIIAEDNDNVNSNSNTNNNSNGNRSAGINTSS